MGRTKELKEAYNEFWCEVLGTEEDLYSQMSLCNFVQLKKAVSNINNIITLATTNKFIDYLLSVDVVSFRQADKMRTMVDSISANSNGYDVEYPQKSDNNDFTDVDECKIIAEVKCCIPVNQNSYGAAQEDNIIADIRGLLEGKSKSAIDKQQLSEYMKFLVLLGGSDDDESKKVNTSAEKLIAKVTQAEGYKVKLYSPQEVFDKSTVYVVILNY